LPQDDLGKQTLKEQGVKSLLMLPLMYYTECIGFVGFDTVADYKVWQSAEKSLLTLFADLL
jgi:hypothetical protein